MFTSLPQHARLHNTFDVKAIFSNLRLLRDRFEHLHLALLQEVQNPSASGLLYPCPLEHAVISALLMEYSPGLQIRARNLEGYHAGAIYGSQGQPSTKSTAVFLLESMLDRQKFTDKRGRQQLEALIANDILPAMAAMGPDALDNLPSKEALVAHTKNKLIDYFTEAWAFLTQEEAGQLKPLHNPIVSHENLLTLATLKLYVSHLALFYNCCCDLRLQGARSLNTMRLRGALKRLGADTENVITLTKEEHNAIRTFLNRLPSGLPVDSSLRKTFLFALQPQKESRVGKTDSPVQEVMEAFVRQLLILREAKMGTPQRDQYRLWIEAAGLACFRLTLAAEEDFMVRDDKQCAQVALWGGYLILRLSTAEEAPTVVARREQIKALINPALWPNQPSVEALLETADTFLTDDPVKLCHWLYLTFYFALQCAAMAEQKDAAKVLSADQSVVRVASELDQVLLKMTSVEGEVNANLQDRISHCFKVITTPEIAKSAIVSLAGTLLACLEAPDSDKDATNEAGPAAPGRSFGFGRGT